MRNFVLGKTLAAAGEFVDNLATGAVGFATLNGNGKLVITTGFQSFLNFNNNKKGYFVLGRSAELGGPVILPVFANHFSFSIGEYEAATTFEAEIAIPETIVAGEEYTIIVVKKGVKFNERNKWTASVVAKDDDDTDSIGAKLVKLINSNSESSGVTAEYLSDDTTIIDITSSSAGVDYTILGADALLGAEVNIITDGSAAYGDASYVRDLANKAAADAGFEYTYMGDVNYLYPDYPLNPLKNADSADTGFNILTFRFAEPREVKTVDDVVHQIIQVALPSGIDIDNTLGDLLDNLSAF